MAMQQGQSQTLYHAIPSLLKRTLTPAISLHTPVTNRPNYFIFSISVPVVPSAWNAFFLFHVYFYSTRSFDLK